jgi:hypothetical protein
MGNPRLLLYQVSPKVPNRVHEFGSDKAPLSSMTYILLAQAGLHSVCDYFCDMQQRHEKCSFWKVLTAPDKQIVFF